MRLVASRLVLNHVAASSATFAWSLVDNKLIKVSLQ